jgi:hypothetical protein
MKQNLIIPLKKVFRQLVVSAGMLILFLIPAGLFAQTDSTTQKEEPAAKEESSLTTPSVEFISVQKADNTIDLKATMKAKIKGSLIKLYSMKIVFFAVTDSAEKELGSVITNISGIAMLNCNADRLTTDKEGKLHFKASFAGNKSLEPAEESVAVKRAKLIITPVKGDSLLSVQLKLVELSTGTETVIPETDLGVYVKRSFNPLKIAEGKTDANGELSVEIPNNLPGDAKGNITLLARLDDNELYGNLEAAAVQPWGIPVSDQIKELPRALWSPHPPLWMIITFTILVTAVWGHYIVIVYELFRLRKEQPKATDS